MYAPSRILLFHGCHEPELDEMQYRFVAYAASDTLHELCVRYGVKVARKVSVHHLPVAGNQQLQRLEEQYPQQQALIETAERRYQEWAQDKGTLEDPADLLSEVLDLELARIDPLHQNVAGHLPAVQVRNNPVEQVT